MKKLLLALAFLAIPMVVEAQGAGPANPASWA